MDLYLWLKSLHVLADIAWMAGMLYLPRLFVYHAASEAKSQQSETFKIMERRLLKAIMTPAMVVSWLTGLVLVWQAGYLHAGWLHWKVGLVLPMSALHGYCVVLASKFASDSNLHAPVFYRVLNEVPTVILAGIVILVVVKPF